MRLPASNVDMNTSEITTPTITSESPGNVRVGRDCNTITGRAKRVLLVEDDPDIASLLCAHLRSTGALSICSACDGPMKIIVEMPNHSIEDPFVIAKILSYLEGRGGSQESATRRRRSTRAAASGLLGS